MIYGLAPFKGKRRQKTFASILHKELVFPSSIPVSLAAGQLISARLRRDPAIKLEFQGGSTKIKEHTFFSEINWHLIGCMDPLTLDASLLLIAKDPNAKEVHWDGDGVLPTNKIELLEKESKHMVVFTGVGISTSCGILDFRGPKGICTLQE